VTAPTHARRLVAVLGASALVATVLLLAPSGRADAASTPTASAPADADDHELGSQIARHEGRALGRSAVAGRSGAPGPGQTIGLDVSGHQRDVNWPAVVAGGARFAYVKATEGTTYRNPFFAQQYNGSYQAGLVRGAYHFARPDVSNGVAQADHFVNHGGGWSRDGRTLPPALDMEYNPYGDACYRLSPPAMVNWIREFSERVRARAGRYPVIYTSTSWWARCTGNDASLGRNNPLWIPRYGANIGLLPAGWATHQIWQYANRGPLPGDQDAFNGTVAQLHRFALG